MLYLLLSTKILTTLHGMKRSLLGVATILTNAAILLL